MFHIEPKIVLFFFSDDWFGETQVNYGHYAVACDISQLK